jgi:hemoglobin
MLTGQPTVKPNDQLAAALMDTLTVSATTRRRMTDETVFELIGEDGFSQLIAAFYRHVAKDDVLRPLYPEQDLQPAEERLRDFLVFRFGGPPRYIEQRGHPALRMRHAPFAVNRAAHDHWLAAMEKAFAESELDPQAEPVLRKFFVEAAAFLINRAD